MAVTSSTGNFLTLIQEDGSDPSGSGGRIINGNFQKLDEAFSLASGSPVANRAEYANYAGYAYSCSGGGSNTSAQFALAAGFTQPEVFTNYAQDGCHPYAVWGNYGSFYLQQYSDYYIPSGAVSSAYLPPFGPLCLKIFFIGYRAGDSWSSIAGEVWLFGWNLTFYGSKVIHAADLYGDEANLTVSFSGTSTLAQNCLCAEIVGGKLQLTLGLSGGGTCWLHARVEGVYPSPWDNGTSSSYVSGSSSGYSSGYSSGSSSGYSSGYSSGSSSGYSSGYSSGSSS